MVCKRIRAQSNCVCFLEELKSYFHILNGCNSVNCYKSKHGVCLYVCMSVCFQLQAGQGRGGQGAGQGAGQGQGRARHGSKGRANTRPLLSIIDRARQGRTGPVGYI